jgi:hypothetical protein
MRKCNYCKQHADGLYAAYNNLLMPYCRNCNNSTLDDIGGVYNWIIVEKQNMRIRCEDMYFT